MPYAIIRPCALTEEPAGADLIFDQGDNITVCFSIISQVLLLKLKYLTGGFYKQHLLWN